MYKTALQKFEERSKKHSTHSNDVEPINWIAERIIDEYNKHAKNGLDWAGIAAIKIESEMSCRILEAIGREDGKDNSLDEAIGYDKAKLENLTINQQDDE